MFCSVLFRCRARAALAASCAIALSTPISATLLPGYSAGTGANTSQLVLDFAFIGGDAYLFEYRYDGSATAEDMLLALDAAGDLTVDYQYFNFGTPSLFVNGFAFDGNSEVPVFEGSAGENWSFWIADSNAGPYSPAATGPTDRVLSDGSVDGWALNVSSFNSGGFTATNDPPSYVPEPTGAALLALAGLAVARRRRR